MPVENAVTVPEQGQIVTVRQRPYVVTEVRKSELPSSPLSPDGNGQHLVALNSIADDGLGETLEVIWELEPGARVREDIALPDVTGFDSPQRLDAFLDAVRWGAIASADVRDLQAKCSMMLTQHSCFGRKVNGKTNVLLSFKTTRPRKTGYKR